MGELGATPGTGPEEKEWELFDLEKDPHELHNAYNDHEYIEVIKKMKSEIIHQRNLLGDIDKDNVEIHEIISNHWN